MDRHATLAQLVAERPARAAVFDGFGLDYCCGGREAFAEACDRLGLDADLVERRAEGAPAVAAGTDANDHDCAGIPLADLVEHLLCSHHEYLHGELPALHSLSAKVLATHGEAHPELETVHRLVTAFVAELEPHLMKEERVLFPAILQLLRDPATEFGFVTIANPIRMMAMEHDHAGTILAELRAATDNYRVPEHACASWAQLWTRLETADHDTRLHIFEENALLFPQVLELETGAPA